jgi:hypothetical protein
MKAFVVIALLAAFPAALLQAQGIVEDRSRLNHNAGNMRDITNMRRTFNRRSRR